jgi:hypothetical protein
MSTLTARTGFPSTCAVTLVVLAACLVPISSVAVDPDLWGHVRFGQDILRDHSIARTDIYSYMTTDSDWINHEWLAEVIFAATYNSAGAAGLIALKTTLGMVLAATVFAFLRRQGLTAVRSGIVLFATLCGMQAGLATLRPHLFTYLAFAAVLLVIHAVEGRHHRWLAALPVIFALWVNLHGGFLAGFALMAMWLGIRLWRARPGGTTAPDEHLTVPRLLLVAVASGLALLVNPYGYRLLLFLLGTATVPRPEVTEWAGLQVVSAGGAVYLVLLAMSALGIAFAPQRRNLTLAVLLCAMAIGPLVASRHLPLFALTVAFFAGPLVAEAWARWKPEVSASRRPRWMTLALVGIAAWCVFLASSHFRTIPIPETYPVQAVDLLKRSGVTGNMATGFNWGEYVIWHLGPEVRVSIDGRRETVYSNDAYRKAYDFWSGRGDWDAVLRAGADLALVEKNASPDNLLSLRDDWVLAYEDDLSRLFVRRGSRQAASLVRTAPPSRVPPENGGARCFP